MKPNLKALSSMNHWGKNVKTWKPLSTKSSYFYRLYYNLLLYKFSDLRPCNLMEGSKKYLISWDLTKRCTSVNNNRQKGGAENPPWPIPPDQIPPLLSPPVNSPRLISPWRVRVRVRVRVRNSPGGN